VSGKETSSAGKRPKVRKRKFYVIGPDYRRGGRLGGRLENDGVIPYGAEHQPAFAEPPRFVFDRKTGDPPSDLEPCAGFWLISDGTKAALEAVDPTAFSFVQCEMRVPHGDWDGPRHWLCEVVRVLDALDETQSRLEIGIRDDDRYLDFGKKFYDFSGEVALVFREDAVGDAHVFRMAHRRSTVICDQVLKDACKSAGLKGIRFRDVSKL